jgi:uncharacterized protein
MHKYPIIFAIVGFSIPCFSQSFAEKQEVRIAAIPFPLSWDKAPLSFKATANSITVTAGKETDLYCFVDGNYYVNTAPKILFTPDSNFVLSVRIKPAFRSLYDGGAILLYSDDGNWAKLLFERHEDGSFGLGSSFVNERRGDDSYHPTVPASEIYVKVARSGPIFNFYYSVDGKAWKLLRTFPYAKFSNLRIGFYAQSPKGESCTVEFSDIRYKGEKFKDYFTGE